MNVNAAQPVKANLSLDVLKDVQGNITPGFRKDFQEFLFLQFPDQAAGKTWVREIEPEISSSYEVAIFNRLYSSIRERSRKGRSEARWEVRRYAQSVWVNVAFTAMGLKLLVPTEFATFLPGDPLKHPDTCLGLDAFSQGLASRYRGVFDYALDAHVDPGQIVLEMADRDVAPLIGAAANPYPTVHALLLVAADTDGDLRVETDRQCDRLPGLGINVVARFRGESLGGGREHFGYRDGVSQPDPPNPLDGWSLSENVVAPGEFILGCVEEHPAGNRIARPIPGTLPHELLRNGSFLTFMKLRQDVVAFRSMVDAKSKTVGLKRAQFAAKLVGRWPSGAKIGDPKVTRASIDKTDPAWDEAKAQITNAEFTADQDGFRFPLFAHVRKVNPRIVLRQQARPADLRPRRRRLIRRGIPYGKPLKPGTKDREDRGLLFVSYQANLCRQFEHVADEWLGADFPQMQAPGTGGAVTRAVGYDPIIGRRDVTIQFMKDRSLDGQAGGGNTVVDIQLPKLVSLIAGGYFFAPAISRIAKMAN